MKKFLSILMAIMMVAMLGITAFAATITITNPVVGQTYNAYKIFDVTKAENATTDSGYSYEISGDSDWYTDVKDYANVAANGLTLTGPTAANTYVVSISDTVKNTFAANFAAYLNGKTEGKTPDKTETANADSELTITVEKAGYYFVDSSLGALCVLNTAADTVNITEKNEKPTLAKKVRTSEIGETTETYGDSKDANFHEDVKFQLTVGVIEKPEADYVITDTLPSGMTYNDDISIEGWTKGTDYTVTYTNDVMTITLKQIKLDSLTFNEHKADVVIYYTANVDADATTGTAGNENKATLTYHGFTTTDTKATVYTYEFDIVKTNTSDTVITGAKFKLYDAVKNGNEIKLVKNTDGTYRLADTNENGVEIEAGNVIVKGLANGTYYLEETKAPDGYNMLAERKAIEIKNDNLKATLNNEGTYKEGGVEVENSSGSQLPSTGGIGTTIFYVVGGLLMAGAVVLLVTKKKMSVK